MPLTRWQTWPVASRQQWEAAAQALAEQHVALAVAYERWESAVAALEQAEAEID